MPEQCSTESSGFSGAELSGEIFRKNMILGRTCISGFAKWWWSEAGIFVKVFKDLADDADMQDISIDSTCIKAHKASAGAKSKIPDSPNSVPKANGKCERFEKNQCIGNTRGSRNTKIQAVVNALENPIHVQLSSGDIHDSIIIENVLTCIPG